MNSKEINLNDVKNSLLEIDLKKTVENVRNEGLDKFYTIPSYSKKCIDKVYEIYENNWDLIIEPSAGNGSFLLQIPSDKKIGIDICPEHDDIIEKDFFDYIPPHENKNILVIGNPPFGRVSSIAVKFFNYSSQWARVIAFIVPRTFRKTSVQNKLNNLFHLVYDEDVPTVPCCFSPKMAVKCCFQIWEKRSNPRIITNMETSHDDWDFLGFGPKDKNGQPTPPEGADFAIRAYGGKCGEIQLNNLHILRPKSWHWIKCKIDKEILINRFNSLDYSNSLNTARQNSIGRAELVNLYCSKFN